MTKETNGDKPVHAGNPISMRVSNTQRQRDGGAYPLLPIKKRERERELSMNIDLAQYPCGFQPLQAVSRLSTPISFTVPGTPVAKGRPRSFIRGGRIGHFTPEKTVRYESLVAHEAGFAMGAGSPLEGAVRLCVMAYFPIPASWSLKRQNAALDGLEHVAKKPDLDNVVKAVKDGMNGVAWRDDCQVVSLVANKEYSDRPRVEVTFEAM